MRIIYVCGYNNRVSGGVQNVFPEYCRHMSKYEVVLVLSFGGAIFSFTNDVQVFYSKEELLHCIRTVDLVVFHEVYYLSFYSFAKKIHAMHIPYIIIPHGSFTRGAQSQKKYAKRIFNFLWVNRFVKQSEAIQFLSEGEWRNSICEQKEQLIIPNGINITEKYKCVTGQKNGMKLVFIGRLSIFYKGLDLLIEACRLIKNEMIQKHIFLDIYGTDFEGGRKKLMGLISEFELEECIEIHEGVFDDLKEDVILQHDVFIQTSRYEGQPMGILEAMQYGMPLIVTPGTTFGGIVKNIQCGWSVEEGAQSIADGILKAYLDKSKWEAFGQNAREHAVNNYSWDFVAKKSIQEYRKYESGKNSSDDDNL